MINKFTIGYFLMEFIVCNGLVWLFGFDLGIKEKIILPNVILVAVIGLYVVLTLMLGEWGC